MILDALLHPLDLTGPAFLAYFCIALLAAHIAGKLFARMCRASHADPVTTPDLAPLETAYLAGGRARAIDAALVGLLHRAAIEVRPGGGGFVVGRESGKSLTGLQADLYREIARRSGALEKLRRLRTASIARMETRLAKDGLLLVASAPQQLCTRLALGLPVAAVIALGAAKVVVGMARQRPVVFLVLLLVVALIVLGTKLFNLPLRSTRGEAVLEKLRRRNAALQATAQRRSGDLDESSLLLAVGLFGTAVLASNDLLWMQQGFVNNRSGGSDSASGCSSSGCGGGGGGGCGGCGG